jgi:hypothetical protein
MAKADTKTVANMVVFFRKSALQSLVSLARSSREREGGLLLVDGGGDLRVKCQ